MNSPLLHAAHNRCFDLDDELRWILGQPGFAVRDIAETLRASTEANLIKPSLSGLAKDLEDSADDLIRMSKNAIPSAIGIRDCADMLNQMAVWVRNYHKPLPEAGAVPQRVTREEVITALREGYEAIVTLAKQEDSTTVGFPDMVKIIDHIEEHGLPPKEA